MAVSMVDGSGTVSPTNPENSHREAFDITVTVDVENTLDRDRRVTFVVFVAGNERATFTRDVPRLVNDWTVSRTVELPAADKTDMYEAGAEVSVDMKVTNITNVPDQDPPDTGRCPDGQVWDEALQQCIDTNPTGPGDCADGYFWDEATGTCLKIPDSGDDATGDSCTVSADCPDGYVCIDGVCVPESGSGL